LDDGKKRKNVIFFKEFMAYPNMTKELKQIKLTIFHNDETKSTITAKSLEKCKY